MSYHDGWAAMNLEMPPRVPRTEYSVQEHWPLISKVTGIELREGMPWAQYDRAAKIFMGPRFWNFDFFWHTHLGRAEFGKWATSMGHAQFAPGGTDFRNDAHSPFTTPEEVLAFDPMDKFGRKLHAELVARFQTSYKDRTAASPDGVTMTGTYITLISGLIDLFGWDMLLLAAGTDPEAFGALTNRYAAWVQQYFDALGDANVPVVMVHDDMVWTSGPFMHPDWYRQYVFPNYRKFFRPMIDSGKKIMFTSDGTYTMFLDDIVAAGATGVVMEPTTDMAYFASKYGKTHVFVGNADTRVLLSGTREEIKAEVERCMAIGKRCPGYFMAVGNHIPVNTPVDNAIYYNEMYEKLGKR